MISNFKIKNFRLFSEVEINKLGYDLYEINAECVTVVTINYPL